jgi:hypothetical protein
VIGALGGARKAELGPHGVEGTPAKPHTRGSSVRRASLRGRGNRAMDLFARGDLAHVSERLPKLAGRILARQAGGVTEIKCRTHLQAKRTSLHIWLSSWFAPLASVDTGSREARPAMMRRMSPPIRSHSARCVWIPCFASYLNVARNTRAKTHLCDVYDLARDVREVGQGQVD